MDEKDEVLYWTCLSKTFATQNTSRSTNKHLLNQISVPKSDNNPDTSIIFLSYIFMHQIFKNQEIYVLHFENTTIS